MALEAIRNLKDDEPGRNWFTLEILSTELPFRPEASSQLNALIERTDYLALFERDQRDALSALRVAINQAYYTNDEKLRSRIEEVLLSCMKSAFRERDGNPVSPAESGDTSGSKQAQRLTDIAFRLALRESDQRATVANFSRLMVSFIRACPSASADFDAGLSQFLRPLPAEGLQEVRYPKISSDFSSDNGEIEDCIYAEVLIKSRRERSVLTVKAHSGVLSRLLVEESRRELCE
ncbi:MAG TPA: hypothetical protein VJ810_12645 [Blastocatellia bacterium]|nr:hypothetical protein [Blastocatellia bacterium]